MSIHNDPLKQAFEGLKDSIEKPSEQQKDKMLRIVLSQGQQKKLTLWEKLYNFASVYPWRVAFGLSSVQAITLTMIFGTRYTNLFLGFFGG